MTPIPAAMPRVSAAKPAKRGASSAAKTGKPSKRGHALSALLGPSPAAAFARATGPVAGVDEAGRGPVLGPLVVAGVLVDDEKALAKLGVKDSKKLTPAKREALFDAVQDAASAVAVRVLEPADLDARMASRSLNDVEVEAFADVLTDLAPARAVLDAADVNAHRFGAHVGARLAGACALLAAHKADDVFPCVAAASIIAKVTRDRAIATLQEGFDAPIGSGYSHDVVTRAFLEAYVAEHGDLPSCARRRWETSRRLVPQNRSLTDFTS